MIQVHPFQVNYLSRDCIISGIESDPKNFSSWRSIIAKHKDQKKYVLFLQGCESLEYIRCELEKTPSLGHDNLYEEAIKWSQFDSNIIEIVYDLRRLQMQGHADPTPWKALGYHTTVEELSDDLENNFEDVRYYRRIDFSAFRNYIKNNQGDIIL